MSAKTSKTTFYGSEAMGIPLMSAIGPVSPVGTDGRLGWYGGGGVAGWGIDYTISKGK